MLPDAVDTEIQAPITAVLEPVREREPELLPVMLGRWATAVILIATAVTFSGGGLWILVTLWASRP